jgi:hypothetical protein
MAMMVSPEVAKLFQVLTGEEWPDANEDHLRALAQEWAVGAQALGSQLGPGLRAAVQAIRSEFAGEAERAFAARVSPFIEGDNYIDAAAELFKSLSDYLLKLALDVEYMKLVSIYSLIALLAEIALAIAMSPFTGGASMAWLAARMAIVRFLLRSLLGKLLLQLLQAAVFGIAFQLLIDAAAQATQFAMGTRNNWDTDKTKNAAGVGAMGAALAPFMGGLGKALSSGLTKFLNNYFGKLFGNNWQKKLPEILTDIGTEAFHETLTEALYKYATEGEFDMNPYAATSGAASATGSNIGDGIGNFAFDVNTGPGGGPGGGPPGGPPPEDSRGGPEGAGAGNGPGPGSGNGPGPGPGNGSGPGNGFGNGAGPGAGFGNGPGPGNGNGFGNGPSGSNGNGFGNGNNVGDGNGQSGNQQGGSTNNPSGGDSVNPRGLNNQVPTDTIAGPNPPTSNQQQPPTIPSTLPPPISNQAEQTVVGQEPPPVGSNTNQQGNPGQGSSNVTEQFPGVEEPDASGQQQPVVDVTNPEVPSQQPPVTEGSNPPVVPGQEPPVVDQGSPEVPGQQSPIVGQTNPEVPSQQPPVVPGQEPPVVDQTNQEVPEQQPPAVEGSNPPVVSDQGPPVVDQASPEVSGQQPPAVPGQQPPVVSNQEPPVVDQANPEVSGQQPPVVSNQQPPVVPSQQPPVVDQASPVVSGQQPPVVSDQQSPVVDQANPEVSSQQPPVVDQANSVVPGQQPPVVEQTNSDVSGQQPPVVPGQQPPLGNQPNQQVELPVVSESDTSLTPEQPPPVVSDSQESPEVRHLPLDGNSGQQSNDQDSRQPQLVDPLTQQPVPERQQPLPESQQQPPVVVGQDRGNQSTTPTPPPQHTRVPTPPNTSEPPPETNPTPKTTPNTSAPVLPPVRPKTPSSTQAAATLGDKSPAPAPVETHELVTNPRHHTPPVRQQDTKDVESKGPQDKNKQNTTPNDGEQSNSQQGPKDNGGQSAAPQDKGKQNTTSSDGEQGNSQQGKGEQDKGPIDNGQQDKGPQSKAPKDSGTAPEAKAEQSDSRQGEGTKDNGQQNKGQQSNDEQSKAPEDKGQQSKTQDNGDQNTNPKDKGEQSNSQQSNGEQSNAPKDNSQQDNNNQDNNQPNPQLPQIQREADTARDHVASALGVARSAHRQAQSHLPAITRSVRDANAAVLGTADAVTRAQQRVQDARQHRTNLHQQLVNLRGQQNPNQAATETAIADAVRAVNTARADLTATQTSHTAATNAHNDAVAALGRAQRAVGDARAAVQRINDQLTIANNAAAAAAAATDITTATNQRNTARNAETRANANRDTAKTAAATAEQAKTDAKDAAKQGGVERGLTQLSSLPPGAELTIDTLGPLNQVADMLAGLTGATANSVNTQLTNLGPGGLANAINDGKLNLTTPTGTVEVAITADLHRPPDSRYAPQHTQPSTTSHDSSAESTNPLSESTSSSLPVRVPVLFISPIDAAGGAIRPIVYIGGVVKRAQKFDSGTTSSSSTTTQQTYVPTTMSITATRPGQPPATATVDTGLTLPSITRTNVLTPNPVPNAAFGTLTPVPVTVPASFVPALGNTADAAQVLHDQLLTQHQNPAQVSVGGTNVAVTPTGPPTITLVGATGVDHSHSTSHSNSSSTTRGSDATFGAGLYGGLKGWFVGAFTDFSTGATDGTNPAGEHATSHSTSDTELVYRIDRPMRVGDGNGVVDTVSSSVQVPLPLARSLGLQLPPHLSGSQNVDPSGNRPSVYYFGKDTIQSVNTNDVVRDLSHGLGAKGQAAVNAKFGTQNSARDAIYNAMHGGDQVTWQDGGRTHILDIYARPVPPAATAPSGLTEAGAEDKNADQFRRTYDSKRSARVGVGGAHLYTGTDSPNPNAPKATPEAGLPNPYQGGPTTSGGLPRASITGTWEGGHANKSGYTGKDGRASKYDGDLRDFTGDVEFVTVHRSTKTPNWAQRFFFGDRQLFGPTAENRITGPQKADIDQALAGNPHGRTDLRTVTVNNAIDVSTAEDKLRWATQPLPNSTMNPGIYLGTPPPAPPQVNHAAFGGYTNVEHVYVTPNTTEGVYIAMAKRVEAAAGSTAGPGATRIPPSGSGTWSSWGQRQFTESRPNPAGPPVTTTYNYKNSELTRPDTTSNDAVRDFVGQAGSRGTATQGIGGAPKTTGRMVQTGRLTDFNGELTAKVDYSAPRLIDVRPNGTLRRNQAGDHITGSTKSNAFGIDGEISLGYASKRDGNVGALLRGVFGGGWKGGTSHAVDLTSGAKHTYEYKGPTAFVLMDARYTYEADMNLRNVIKTKPFTPLPVTVDQPNGVVVEMPVAHAIDLFTAAGVPVPTDLAGALPDAKTPMANPAQTLLPGNTGYASYSDTTVVGATLNGPLTQVETTLDNLGVTGKKWRADILGQVDKMLNSPTGHVWLKDVLVGGQGYGGVISVPNSGVALEDVVDIRVTAQESNRPHPAPSARPIVPDKQSNADYVTSSVQDKKNSGWNVAAAIEAGFNSRQVPAVPPGQPDGNGTVQQSKPEAGASAGSFTPQVFGGSKAWKTDEILPTSDSDKVNTQVDTDKVGRTSHEVDYQLTITRRRAPMPLVDTPLLGVPSQFDMDRTAPAVTLPGSVDLLSPSADASPPLARPGSTPTFAVMPAPPARPGPMFDPTGGWRVESIGAGTAKAIHDALYAQLGGQKLPTGQVQQTQIDAAANNPTSYTRPGGNSEYVAHTMTKGSSLHSGANAIFTGDKYHSENTVGGKNTFYDKLFDYGLSADFHQNSFRLVQALPDGTEMNLSQEHETGTPQGVTKTVSTSYGPSLPFFAGSTSNTGAAGPTTVGTGPPVSENITNDVTTATSSKTGGTDGVKYTGRSYLFLANADFYSDVTRKGSNWTHSAVESVRGVFGGRPDPHTVVRIGSQDDLHVRVWEQEALDKGLITISDVWHHANKPPPSGFTVTPAAAGAVLHPAGQPAPAAPAATPPGRTLHVADGVGVADVRSFIETLPRDMRPTTYTVDPNSLLTPDDIHTAVDDLPEPPPATTDNGDDTDDGGDTDNGDDTDNGGGSDKGKAPADPNQIEGEFTDLPHESSFDSDDDLYSAPTDHRGKAPATEQFVNNGKAPAIEPFVNDGKGKAPANEPLVDPADQGGEVPAIGQFVDNNNKEPAKESSVDPAGQSGQKPTSGQNVDQSGRTPENEQSVGLSKQSRDEFQSDSGPATSHQRGAPPAPGSTDQLGAPFDGTFTPQPPDDATGHTPTESGPGKRSRDEFEVDGPSTRYEPPATRPMPEQLVPPSQADVDALRAVVPPGTRFTDPADFAALINGARTDLGRDVNCVDASLAFHSTWHGDPRVAGAGPAGATTAAEELGYAPELVGRGADGLAEVIDRVRRGGHGSDALVFGFPRTGRGHAWNVVNHHGHISIVDSQAGTVRPAEPGALPDLDRVYAIPLDVDNEFITEPRTPPPAAPSSSDPYVLAEHERAVRVHEMRTAAAAGEEIAVPGGSLVPSLGGLRLVGATVTAAIAAELAALTGRDVIALVIGADAEEPEPLRFTPTGRPLPV